jgi:Glycosyltransferase family 87
MRWTIATARASGLILIAVLAHGLWSGGGRMNSVTGRPFLHDQIPFHAAGVACRTGHCDDLYDQATQRALQTASFGPGERPDHRPYVAPPHTALLYVIPSLLPFSMFAAAAAALNLVLLFAALRLLGAGPGAVLAAFGFYPVFDGFGVGQNVFLSLFLFAAALRLWQAQRGFAAGLVAGLVAAYKPHLLVGVGLLWLVEARRDVRPLAGLLCAMAAFALLDLAFLWQPSRVWAGWVVGALSIGKPLWSGMSPAGEFTVVELFALLLPGSGQLASALTAAALLLGAAAAVRLWRRDSVSRPLAYAFAMVLTLWLVPHAHRYEWTLLLLPGVVLWRELPAWRSRLAATYAGLYLVAAMAIRIARWQLDSFGIALHPAVPALAIAAAACAVAIERARREEPARDDAELVTDPAGSNPAG